MLYKNILVKKLKEFIHLFYSQPLIQADWLLVTQILQNIPIKTLDGKEIRKAFIAEKNNVLISADYNQIEMRILADMADVKELKKAFKNNQDIHALTASQVFDVPINKVTDDYRRKAKAINFGIIYGITQYGLVKQISVSNQEALDFINAYFKKFPEIKEYMSSTIKNV